MEVVSSEALASWREQPTTKIFFDVLRKRLTEMRDCWVEGNYTCPDAGASAQLNSIAIGQAQAYTKLLSLTAEEVNTELNDEE